MLFSADSDYDIDINNHLKINGTFDAILHFASITSLLRVLKSHRFFKDIPVNARTVLKTNKTKQVNDIQIVAPRRICYYHFGVDDGLNSYFFYWLYSRNKWTMFNDEQKSL